LLSFLLLTSCSADKYIPEGSHLLHDVVQNVEMADSSAVTPEVSDALRKAEYYWLQRPNSKVLGWKNMPVGMWIYCVANPSDSSFWGNYWRNLGQAPVVYEEGKAHRTAQQLEKLLEAKGCFGSSVSFDTVAISGNKISIAYNIKATQRYLIDEVAYHCDNPEVSRLLEEWQPAALLRAGECYDQDKITAERNRLVNNLKEAGYFRASLENISFLVDTTYHNPRLSIDVNVDSSRLAVYHINNVYIYPNSTAGLHSAQSAYDTTIFNYQGPTRSHDFAFVYDKPMTLKKEAISRAMMLFPGMIYRPRHITNTYNSLLNLRNFKYINIDFVESPFSDESMPLVDAHVRLINTTQQKISLSLELTNASPISTGDSGNFFSSGNLGIETALEYQHKNLFGGAEMLKVKGSLLLELPKFIFSGGGSDFYDSFSAFEVNLDASLDMPVFLLPLSSHMVWQRTRPHTLISAAGSYQYRYWFERILASTSYGYTWTQRFRDAQGNSNSIATNRVAQHQLLPIELTFVRILNIDPSFASRLNSMSDLRVKYQYSSHFIMDARYDYTYSNQHYGLRRNFSFFHLSVESAGNVLNGISHLSGGEVDSIGVRQFLGVPFSQYARLHTEFTRYIYHNTHNTLVARILLGIGLPYGNSTAMPYEKSFFGGGPTTMRAWQLRHLGPGSFNSGDNMLERVGDLQLVCNIEERFPIAGIFEGAIFADLGNVWLFNSSDQYPGGEIKWDGFLKEIAVGIGLGLRVNVSVATLRLDFAIPLYDPGFSPEARWRLPHWSLRQIVTNFGINYPF
jgi:hypothetical protein